MACLMAANRTSQFFRLAIHKIHVDRVELAIKQPHLHTDRGRDGLWKFEFVMCILSRSWRNLMHIERNKNVLSVTSINSIAVAIEHEVVDKVGPFIDAVVFLHLAAGTDPLISDLTDTSSQTSLESVVP